MHSSSVILLVGEAGSGKDTVADFMVKNHGAIKVAQADPMKRLAKVLFGFTEEQLWGPSECRNAVDARFDRMDAWKEVEIKLYPGPASAPSKAWLADVFGTQDAAKTKALTEWFHSVQAQTYLSDKQLTPRLVLQTLGTEFGRAVSRDVWSNYAINVAFKILGGGYQYDKTIGVTEDSAFAGPARVVITDGRFRNEVVNVRRVGGNVIRIDSPSIDNSAVEAAGVKGHASEAEQKKLPKHFFTGFLMNDKGEGLEACERNVGALVRTVDAFWVSAGYANYELPK
jgi:hypothetical protein